MLNLSNDALGAVIDTAVRAGGNSLLVETIQARQGEGGRPMGEASWFGLWLQNYATATARNSTKRSSGSFHPSDPAWRNYVCPGQGVESQHCRQHRKRTKGSATNRLHKLHCVQADLSPAVQRQALNAARETAVSNAMEAAHVLAKVGCRGWWWVGRGWWCGWGFRVWGQRTSMTLRKRTTQRFV